MPKVTNKLKFFLDSLEPIFWNQIFEIKNERRKNETGEIIMKDHDSSLSLCHFTYLLCNYDFCLKNI